LVHSPYGWAPMVNRILREPYGDVTAVAQCIVVVSPIRDFVERLLYLVAPALVEFVGHEILGRAVWPGSCLNLGLMPSKSIYSTTPSYTSIGIQTVTKCSENKSTPSLRALCQSASSAAYRLSTEP
jgi:hypothetical protein